MASMRFNGLFYIQGGDGGAYNRNATRYNQFFSLDLGASWSVHTPPWKRLPNGGTHSFNWMFPMPDKKSIVVLTGVEKPAEPGYMVDIYDGTSSAWRSVNITIPERLDMACRPVQDPTTGLVYVVGVAYINTLNLNTLTWTNTTIPPNVLQQRFYGGSVYNRARKSFMYFGGYSYRDVREPAPYITEYSIASGTWSVFDTTGDVPTLTADACMTASDDGNTIVFFGGTMYQQDVAAPKTLSNRIYVLNVITGVWKQGPLADIPRIYTGCTLVGSNFLAWGGLQGLSTLIQGPPVVYDLRTSQWATKFTTLSEQPPWDPSASPSSSSDGPNSSSSPSSSSSSSSNMGAIVAGAVGGVLAVALGGGAFLYGRRKMKKARCDSVKRNPQDGDGGGTQTNNNNSNNGGASGNNNDGNRPQGPASEPNKDGFAGQYPDLSMMVNNGTYDPHYYGHAQDSNEVYYQAGPPPSYPQPSLSSSSKGAIMKSPKSYVGSPPRRAPQMHQESARGPQSEHPGQYHEPLSNHHGSPQAIL
ncbi:hypothetical protein BGX31_007967 [Mortierella sp. GBA43]|nr:hypothetical protein BGX31_007967 [Mortierella sp. GBA43]